MPGRPGPPKRPARSPRPRASALSPDPESDPEAAASGVLPSHKVTTRQFSPRTVLLNVVYICNHRIHARRTDPLQSSRRLARRKEDRRTQGAEASQNFSFFQMLDRPFASAGRERACGDGDPSPAGRPPETRPCQAPGTETAKPPVRRDKLLNSEFFFENDVRLDEPPQGAAPGSFPDVAQKIHKHVSDACIYRRGGVHFTVLWILVRTPGTFAHQIPEGVS